MSNKRYTIILVHSTSRAMRGEHLLTRAGIDCKLIPVPRMLSSDCGVCLRVRFDDRERALETLQAGKLEADAVHDI